MRLDTKIRMFPYKILNNILNLNQRLYRMNLVESPLCSLCKREVESISHLFLNANSPLDCGQRHIDGVVLLLLFHS